MVALSAPSRLGLAKLLLFCLLECYSQLLTCLGVHWLFIGMNLEQCLVAALFPKIALAGLATGACIWTIRGYEKAL